LEGQTDASEFSNARCIPSASWNEVLGVIFLLAERLWKCGYSSDDSCGHEKNGNHSPNNTPTLGRSSILLGENTGVGRIHFAKNEIVTYIPNAVKGRHNAYEKLRGSVYL